MKLIYALMTSAVLASTVAAADQQKLQVTRQADTARVIWLQDGQSQTIELSKEDLADKNRLAEKLAVLPANKKEELVQMLSGDGLTAMQWSPELAGKGAHKVLVKKLDAEGQSEKRVIKVIDAGDHADVEFEVLKQLLQDSQLSKEQLLELQKLLDKKF